MAAAMYQFASPAKTGSSRGFHSILGEPPTLGSVLVILLPPHGYFRRVAFDSQFIQKG